MPRCTGCRETKRSTDLEKVKGRGALCGKCRRPLRLVEDLMKEKPERDNNRLVFSVNVYELDTPDGGIDHRVEVSGNYGGLNLRFSSTVDEIRDFFTKKRVREAALSAVK